MAAVHPTRKIPHVAEVVVSVGVIGAVLAGGLVAALSFSAFAVLLYYAVTNAAALRLAKHERRGPRALAWAGLVSCLALAASLPWQTIVVGVAAAPGEAAARTPGPPPLRTTAPASASSRPISCAPARSCSVQ
jgi:APA family basic amino acid/polyamine antiporter